MAISDATVESPIFTSAEEGYWLEIEIKVGRILVKPNPGANVAAVLTNALKDVTTSDNDADKMKDTWRCVWHQRDGKADLDKQVGTRYTFDGSVMSHKEKNGKLISRWAYKLSQTTSPKEIDFVRIGTGSVYHSIYWLQGDTLTILESICNEPRPTHFADGGILTVLQRHAVQER